MAEKAKLNSNVELEVAKGDKITIQYNSGSSNAILYFDPAITWTEKYAE